MRCRSARGGSDEPGPAISTFDPRSTASSRIAAIAGRHLARIPRCLASASPVAASAWSLPALEAASSLAWAHLGHRARMPRAILHGRCIAEFYDASARPLTSKAGNVEKRNRGCVSRASPMQNPVACPLPARSAPALAVAVPLGSVAHRQVPHPRRLGDVANSEVFLVYDDSSVGTRDQRVRSDPRSGRRYSDRFFAAEARSSAAAAPNGQIFDSVPDPSRRTWSWSTSPAARCALLPGRQLLSLELIVRSLQCAIPRYSTARA